MSYTCTVLTWYEATTIGDVVKLWQTSRNWYRSFFTAHRHSPNSAHIAHKKHICAGIRIMQTMVAARWRRKAACSCMEDRWQAPSHNCTATIKVWIKYQKSPETVVSFFTCTRTVFSGWTRASCTCGFWKTVLTCRRQVLADHYSHLHGRVGLSCTLNLAWQLKCWRCYTAPSVAAVSAGLWSVPFGST